MKRLLAWLGLLIFAFWSPLCASAETEYGSFVYDDSEPNALFLGFPITPSSPLDFGRAMRAHPDIVALIVFSGGGDVTGALVIAEQVHDRGLATIVPAGTGCYSACAYIFFAGTPRFAAGDLGVHQFSGGPEDMSSVQYSVAEIVDALTRFGTPPTVLADMFRTTPQEMFVYTPQDAVRLGLNTADGRPEERRADIDPATLTVLPMTRHRGISGGGEERLIKVENTRAARGVLASNGFTEAMIDALIFVGAGAIPETMPAGAMLKVLYGPSRSSDGLIPYRITYLVPVGNGKVQPRVTVALNDNGQYAVGIDPLSLPPRDSEVDDNGKGPRERSTSPVEPVEIFASPLSSIPSPSNAPRTFPDDVPSPAAIYLAANGSQGAIPKYGRIWWSRDVDGYGDAMMVAEVTVQLAAVTFEAKIAWQKNHDATLPAASTMTANFHHVGPGVADEVASVPGVLAKSESMVRGKPLVGASAMVREGEFIFATTADEPSSTENAMLLNERYIDVAITLKSGRNAILTLEKDDAAQAAFRDVMESWFD